MDKIKPLYTETATVVRRALDFVAKQNGSL
jgi:hypothetical protein